MNTQVANVQLMQKMNRLKVLNFVRRTPDASRPQISEKTGLSMASITNVTSYLLEIGLLKECGTEKVGRVGRKSTLLRFRADKYDLICVHLNENYMNIAYTDLEGKPIEKIRIETNGLTPEEITDELIENIKFFVNKYDKTRVLSIGIAISGLVLDDSRFVFSSRLKWKSLDIKKAIEAEVALPVFVNNMSFLKAGWYFGKKVFDSQDNMLYVDMENGIGAVQYLNGAILRKTVGEIGHTTVEPDGEPCFCGNNGCLEAMCSPKRMMSLFKEKSGINESSVSNIDKLYKEENESAIFAVSECGKYLGIGLANLVNLFNPTIMVINAGDFDGCPSLLIQAEKELRRRAYSALMQKMSIKHINESEENTVFAIAFDLCNRLFQVDYPDNII